MFKKTEKKESLAKIVVITSTIVLSAIAIGTILYKLFTKYCKVTFECDSNCDDCLESDCCCGGEVDGEVFCDCEDEDANLEAVNVEGVCNCPVDTADETVEE